MHNDKTVIKCYDHQQTTLNHIFHDNNNNNIINYIICIIITQYQTKIHLMYTAQL